MLYGCSNCPGQSQLETVVKELFQVNGFDVEVIIDCKHWIHDGHAKIVSTSTVGEFAEQSAKQQIKQQPIIMQVSQRLHI
jgi:hypothetical protein